MSNEEKEIERLNTVIFYLNEIITLLKSQLQDYKDIIISMNKGSDNNE